MTGIDIKFHDDGIAQCLSIFDVSVPTYQRDYSWKKEYVKTYLEDLSLAIQTGEPIYFLGSLVFIHKAKNQREVVDGQQRLATTSLLLAAMRQLSGKGSVISRGVERMILSGIIGKADDPKMILNSSDAVVFSSLITEGTVGSGFVQSRTSHKRLSDAYDCCKSFMEQQSKSVAKVKIDTLFEAWINYLQFCTKVIVITVGDELNAFRMFETLNDRGMKVSQADLIKNYLFMKSNEKITHAQELWGSIKGTLEALDDDEAIMNLIRYYLMANDSFVEKKNIYTNIMALANGENAAIKMLNNLDKFAKYFVAIHNPLSPIWKGFSNAHKKNIEAICLFDLTAIKPLLLGSIKLKPKECEEVYKYALSAAVRLLLASRSRTTSASVERPISECSIKISKDEITTIKQIKKYLVSTIPNDKEFASEFLTASSSKPKLARYFLMSMENAKNKIANPGHLPSGGGKVVTLEHVLPRSTQGNWDQFTEDEHVAYYRRLGNLAIVDGDDMGSDSFPKKKPILKLSSYETTKMIAECNEWNIKDIEDRQSTLAELAVKAWPV